MPKNPLAAIATTRLAALLGSRYGLRGHDPSARIETSVSESPQALAEHLVNALPNAIHPLCSEVVVDGLPGKKALRKHAPLATSLQHVEDSVKDLARVV